MPREPLHFSGAERVEVDRALALAEARTAAFYGIPGREWPRFPYDVRTLAEGPGPRARVFADVVRAVPRRERGAAARRLPRFRVRLRDDVILEAVEEGDVALHPLLTVVLVHELVHVVRFGGGLADFDAAAAERRAEEVRVHAITRRILAAEGDPAFGRIAEAYLDEATPPFTGSLRK